jgi:hypothetical protein
VQRFQASIEISAPAEQVFTYVSDLLRHGEWAAHKLRIEPQGGNLNEPARKPAAPGTSSAAIIPTS